MLAYVRVNPRTSIHRVSREITFKLHHTFVPHTVCWFQMSNDDFSHPNSDDSVYLKLHYL